MASIIHSTKLFKIHTECSICCFSPVFGNIPDSCDCRHVDSGYLVSCVSCRCCSLLWRRPKLAGKRPHAFQLAPAICCRCLAGGRLLDGVTFNHYTHPFAQWKTCHKMAETCVSRPHFEELTQVSAIVRVSVGIFSKVLFSQTSRDTPESAVWTPLMNRILGEPVRRLLAR